MAPARRRQRSGYLRNRGTRSRSVLGRFRRRTRMDAAVGLRPEVESASRALVRRRQDQRERELCRSARARRAPQQGGDHLGGGAGRPTHAHLLGSVPPGEHVRERAQVARGQARRPRRALSPAGSGARDCDARVRTHRCRPQRRLRRIQCGVAARPDQRCAGRPSRHCGRRLPARQSGAAQADGGRGTRGNAVDQERRRRPEKARTARIRVCSRRGATSGITD